MSIAYTIRISLDCPHCRGGVPVNGFTNEVLCSNCLKSVELPQEWWETHLDSETIDEALEHEPGYGNSSQSLGGMSEKIDTGNRAPRCQDCKAEFPDALYQGAVAAGGFACPGCNRRVRVRKATPLALSLIPEADLLIHEDATGDQLSTDGVHAAEPVMFACLSCGGGLSVDGSSRTPKCDHCGNANYLPDALWLRLHPAATSHAFFVTRSEKAKAQAAAPMTPDSIKDDLSEEKALRILKDENLEPETLRRIHRVLEDEDDVLVAIAKHRRCPDDLLLQLCDSGVYYGVREAVAKRPDLSVKVLQELASDSDSDVKRALIKRQGLYQLPQHVLEDILRGQDLDDLGQAIMQPDFPEWKLYEISDNCAPEEAGRILRAPNVSARVLRRLGSNPDSRAKIKAHPIYQNLGWFAKLMFFAGS